MRHGDPERDPAKALPGDRVRHLTAERLEAELVAELQEHEPQIGLDRHRGPTKDRVEVPTIGGEEHLVVEQAVDRFELEREAPGTSPAAALPKGSAGRLPFSTWWPRSVLVLRVETIIPASG